jgi:Heparinase II/III-like protein
VSGDELPTPPELSHHDLETYYTDSGVLVSRPAPGQDLAITIKAGGNTTHSHNDIGSFVIGLDGVQPVGDPGGPRYYTKATFGPHRLDSRLLNSFGHPVPEIGGHLQLDATKVNVNVLSRSFEPERDSITIDMTPAYDTPVLRSLTRTMVHSRIGKGSIDITDEFDLEQPAEIIESLPTHGSWKKIDDRTLLFTQNGKRLKVAIDAPAPISVNETRVDDYGNSFTRVAVHIPMQGHESVTLHFAPVN